MAATRPTSARATARRTWAGIDADAEGAVVDGNDGNNYSYTFVPESTGEIAAGP